MRSNGGRLPEAMELTRAVWALSDGAAGNRRQALALAGQLAAGPVREWILTARPPWRWLSPRRLPGSEHAFGNRFAAALDTRPELAIGCGRQAALATRLLRDRGALTVQILDPRLSPRHWDALVVPEHDAVGGDNVVTTVGSLHTIDDRWLANARQNFPELEMMPGPCTLVLLGGPVAGVKLDPDWWARCVKVIEHWLDRDGGSVLLAGSRRTPDWLERSAREWLDQRAGRVWFNDGDGDNPYPGFLARADRIVVSPDSTNLISEACATRAPVFIAGDLGPGRVIAGRHARMLRALVESGRTRPLKPKADSWPIEPLRETPRVVTELRNILKWAAPEAAQPK